MHYNNVVMARSTFLQKLEDACKFPSSLLCVGLDPDPLLMPHSDVSQFNRAIIDATADLVCAYKPNLAFYEALGLAGMRALEQTVTYVRQAAPHALVIGDGKRGDIGSTAFAYARAMFQVWDFDAVTVNPYLGRDSLQPFLDYQERGIFVVCRSSNPGSGDFQDLPVVQQSAKVHLYQQVAMASLEWNTHGNVGLVVGASHVNELQCIRELCPDMPFLIPGVGAQGADLDPAVHWGTDARGRLAIINSSRGIIYASKGIDFPSASRKEAARLRDEINSILERERKGWP